MILDSLNEHKKMFDNVTEKHLKVIEIIGGKCVEAYKNGNKIFTIGNGGSAADAQHFAAELEGANPPMSCTALSVNTSSLTAIGNDYSYDDVFERQIKSNAKKGDIIFAFSTSGTSKNVIKAVITAKGIGCFIVSFTSEKGKMLIDLSDLSIVAPTLQTPRAQEYHEWVYHTLWKIIVSGLND